MMGFPPHRRLRPTAPLKPKLVLLALDVIVTSPSAPADGSVEAPGCARTVGRPSDAHRRLRPTAPLKLGRVRSWQSLDGSSPSAPADGSVEAWS